MLEFILNNIFCRKTLQADSRHSDGYKLCPSSHRHLSVFIRNGIHSLCSQRERNSISVQSHLQYVDDVLSKNNKRFEIYLGHIYPVDIEIKDTSESITSAPYLDLQLSIWRDGQLHTSIYDNRDDFNFNIKNFLFLNTNLPSSRWRFYLAAYTIRSGFLLT